MPPRTLIIDGEPAIRATITEVLVEEGYVVESATNGAEGLAAVTRALPSLVIVPTCAYPCLMAGASPAAQGVRGCAIDRGADAAKNAARSAEETGAAGVLAKPFGLASMTCCA